MISNGNVRVGRTGVAPLAPGVTRDGEIADPEALAAALKELFAQTKLPRNVRVGVANQRVVVRTIRMPQIEDRKELETAIRFQAQDEIPMPLEQAVLDWQVIGQRRRRGRRAQMDVVVVAARRDMVSRAGLGARGRRPEAGRDRRLRLRDDPRARRRAERRGAMPLDAASYEQRVVRRRVAGPGTDEPPRQPARL